MFEERYRKLYQDVAPSEELSQETVELMIEARNHRAKPLPTPKSKLPLILWLSTAGTAVAALIVTIGVLAWINRGDRIDEELGVFEPETESVDPSAPQQNEGSIADNEAATDTMAPEMMEIKSDRFTSFEDYFAALDAKKTIGYGEKYYLTKELIILAEGLPKGAELTEIRQFEDGSYSYTYRVEQKNDTFLISIQVSAYALTTEQALADRLALLEKEEKPTFTVSGNTRTYQFGGLETVFVMVTREATETDTPQTETPDSTPPANTKPDAPDSTEPDAPDSTEPALPESSAPGGIFPSLPDILPGASEEGFEGSGETAPAPETADLPVTAEEPAAGETVAGESAAGYDPNGSVSSPVQPAPPTQAEVDALLKDFNLYRYTAEETDKPENA